ncbi:MAG: PLDc N-terminal domain-containing protein [Bacteroidales bacterium]|nr:PLDc N-terminal domain-containing protein [Bacteroidales bacterium]
MAQLTIICIALAGVVLLVTAILKLVDTKMEPVNKVVWLAFILCFFVIGSITFLVWRRNHLKISS